VLRGAVPRPRGARHARRAAASKSSDCRAASADRSCHTPTALRATQADEFSEFVANADKVNGLSESAVADLRLE